MYTVTWNADIKTKFSEKLKSTPDDRDNETSDL
jgi:hypothetical protein